MARIIPWSEMQDLPAGSTVWEECNDFSHKSWIARITVRAEIQEALSPVTIRMRYTLMGGAEFTQETRVSPALRYWDAEPTPEEMAAAPWT